MAKGKSTLGEDWYQSFATFRINPETFMDRKKLTRDAFCLDALKDLCMDSIDTQCKIHLLLLIQEHSTFLIRDKILLEQVVGSLINLFEVLGAKSEKKILKSQTLVTITTVLLTWNPSKDVYKMILKLQTMLLEIIYRSVEDAVVLSSACRCLEEIEEFYNNNLESDVTKLIVSCEKETSPAFQSYVLLLSKCVKHMAMKIYEKNNTDIKEPQPSPDFLTSSVAHLLEYLPLMTPTSVYRILKDLIYVVKETPKLSPMMFKLYLQNLLQSSNVLFFHLTFDLYRFSSKIFPKPKEINKLSGKNFPCFFECKICSDGSKLFEFPIALKEATILTFCHSYNLLTLKEAFGSRLFTHQDEGMFFKQLTKMCTHPCLISSQRLLYLDWLKSCVKSKAYLTSTAFHTDMMYLFPSPFDGPLTQEKKAHILSLSIPPETKDNLTGEFLNESASGLIKCSLLSGGTKAAPSLFRTLFIFFSLHKSEVMRNSMYRLLTGIVKNSLHLTPYALSFLEAVRKECNSSLFHEKVLDHLVEHILSIPMKLFNKNLEYYLSILESAAQENASICRPRAVLRLLQRFLNSKISEVSIPWSIGNDILTICRLFLEYHDVQIFYYDLAEVLCLIIQNADDIDVRDRAKIYYSMLTSLSKLKIQTIFSFKSSEKESKNAFRSFVTGDESFQKFAFSIQRISNPILQLERIERSLDNCDEINEIDESFPDILEMYTQHMVENDHSLKLTLKIKRINVDDKHIRDLYSLVIITQADPAAKHISVIEVPVFKGSTLDCSKGPVADVTLVLREPYTTTLHFKAEFTCENGYSYSCVPSPVLLKFQDLFMPLPVPKTAQQSILPWRKQLFNTLWNKFMDEITKTSKTSYCRSSFVLKMNKEDLHATLKNWRNFIVSKSDQEYNAAMLLPSKTHILLKFKTVNDKPFVSILVDKKEILPCVTEFLQNINNVS